MTIRRNTGGVAVATIWTLLVVVALGVPGDELPTAEVFDWFDKLVHAALFAVHLALVARALAPRWGVAVSASASLAVVMETLQLWIPGRGWELWDLVAGFAGIALVALIRALRHARLRASS